MSIRVGGRDVPVVWSPSDLSGPDSDGHRGRGGNAILGIAHHRIVGSLETTVTQTFYPTTDDLMTRGERRVSSHLSIGHWRDTGLRVVQHVAFQDTAYCNGQSARDREACRWRTWINAGRPDANEITLSIEHEDNGAAGDYIVRDDTIELSIAIDRLLLSGDASVIRRAGFRCSDAAAAQLGRIKPTTDTIIDHHVIAPISKPYCWRPYNGDKVGFPQARYLAALTGGAPEEDMPGLDYAIEATRDNDPTGTIGTAKLLPGTKIRVIRTKDLELVDLPEAADLGVVTRGMLASDQVIGGTIRKAETPIALFNHDGRVHAALWSDIGDSFVALAFGDLAARQAEWDRIRAELKVELPPRPA